MGDGDVCVRFYGGERENVVEEVKIRCFGGFWVSRRLGEVYRRSVI